MNLGELHRRTVEAWLSRLEGVGDSQWSEPTPCGDWDVRALVNHMVGEELWTVPLVAGATLEEVGDRFAGDLLGADPRTVGARAASAAVAAVEEGLGRGGTVHLSFGETAIEEYVWQLSADHLVHTWDLAVATQQDPRLDPALVDDVAGWFADREALYRDAGVIGPRVAGAGDPQTDLLAAFGRPAVLDDREALTRFSAAFGAGDVDAIMALMTDDVVFEATGPAPDGERHEGADAVRAVWVDLFEQTRGARFGEEESFVQSGRGVLRWRFEWENDDGSAGHVRGVDVIRFRDGKVAEKLSYVKG